MAGATTGAKSGEQLSAALENAWMAGEVALTSLRGPDLRPTAAEPLLVAAA